MRYLILRVPGHEYHQDLCYCLVPLCEPVCRFVATEAQRFRNYMLRDRFHVTSILWQGLPALYWYETLLERSLPSLTRTNSPAGRAR